jgi:glycosyltransferase involved in cell wall biosynthesis
MEFDVRAAVHSLKSNGVRPRIVVGVTSAQTCLVLRGRLRALREPGFEVTLVGSPGKLLTHTSESEGVAFWPVPMKRGIAPLSDLWAWLALVRLLRRLRPEISDFSTPKAGLLGNLAAWTVGVPQRVYTLRGLKLESSRGWKRKVLLQSERVAAACAHRVLCNSESLRDEAMRLGIAPAEKLVVLGEGSSNGVDTRRFSPGKFSPGKFSPERSDVRARLGIGADELVIGFVGRLTRDKGVPELMEAFDAVLVKAPSCRLLLVGWFDEAEDALSRSWQRRILNHPQVKYTGFVADTAPYYRAMDLLILPTHREGFPNVVLEAAASGLPVITTESTGSRDAVLSEVTGLLIPPRIPEAITDAALELIRDEAKRKRMGVAARAWVVERFSQERVLGLAVEFYLGMMEGRD